jgi:hypothetical protein
MVTSHVAWSKMLVERIYYDEGSLEEQERWLKMVERWETSNDMYETEALALAIAGKRLAARLRVEFGSLPTQDLMVALAQRIIAADGTEEEREAWLILLVEATDSSQGSILDDIYWPKDEMSAEEIVERAIARGKRA